MTTHLDTTEAYIAARLRGATGLPLFAEAGATDGRVKATAQMPGAGQLARREARERSHAKRDATYARLAQCLEACPSGLTRKELAEVCALPTGTVNGRVSEMRAFPHEDERRVHTKGRRNGESVVILSRLDPP